MAYLLPVGPWHPALDEPVVYKLEVTGTKIQAVEIELGYNHRGVEKYLPGLLPHAILAPASRICGKCSFANTLGVALALEKLVGLRPPLRTEYYRVAAAELERAASHLANLGKTLRLLGFRLEAARFEDLQHFQRARRSNPCAAGRFGLFERGRKTPQERLRIGESTFGKPPNRAPDGRRRHD
jgi:Ni,Fe-hydrogenase III large subunit